MYYPAPDRQRGATLIGILTIVAILGLGVYGAIRLTPLYLEYMKVARAMEQTATEASGETSPASVRNALGRRWAIEDIERLDVKDIEITKTGDGFEMYAAYRAEAPFVGNVSLVVDFEKTVQVK